MTDTEEEAGPLSTKAYAAEMRQQDVQGSYKSLRAANVVLRVVAVLYFALALIPFMKGLINAPPTPPDGYIIALLTAFVRDAIAAFFTWVFADVVRILLDTRVDTSSLRNK